MSDACPLDVIVIGAGPAGAVASARLAAKGCRVACLESQWFPRYVIGESLLPRCNQIMADAGLLEAVEKRGFMVKRGALFRQGDRAIRFDFSEGLEGDAPTTFQTPRALLDQTLATRARELGADVRFGRRVDAVELVDGGVRVHATDLELETSETLESRWLLDCSGYGRVLPRLFDLESPPVLDPRVAVFSMVEGDTRPPATAHSDPGDIWVCSIDRGLWLWIIPFSDGRSSLGVVGEPNTIDAAGDTDRERLLALIRREPNARSRLAGARVVMPTRRLQAWTRGVRTLHGQGWAIAGNAGEFLDPVFSSGAMLAMESASLAATHIESELAGRPVDWEGEYDTPLRRASSVFLAFIEAWYSGDLERIFYAEQKSDGIRRSIVSVLGGNVMNQKNSLVRNPKKGLATLIQILDRADAAAV